jgi:hypothetical protein
MTHLEDIIRQILLFGHILAFALAMAEVLREDWRMLWATKLDFPGLAATAQRVKWLLIVLWATGMPLVGFDIGWDIAAIADKPKLMMKLIVVAVLTLNGALLHFVAFPLLSSRSRYPQLAATVPSILGAISTVSWLYASFVGVARLIAPKMNFLLFFGFYSMMLAGAIAVAVLFMRHRIARMIAARDIAPETKEAALPRPIADAGAFPVFLEVEVALAAVGHAHNRLMALRNNMNLENPGLFDAAHPELIDRADNLKAGKAHRSERLSPVQAELGRVAA